MEESPKSVTLLLNPAAGRGRAAEAKDSIVAAIGPGSRVFVSTEPGSLAAHVRETVASTDLYLVAGGDGTLNEVASALAGKDADLAILPFGTGNDLARCLGIPRDVEGTVRVALEGRTRRIDLGEWSCGGRGGLFANVAGCGFDARVAARMGRGIRWLRGTPAYIAAVAQELASFRPCQARIEVDGHAFETDLTLAAVANATSYGGGMMISPDSDLEDGLLDVVVVAGTTRWEFLRTFPKVFSGTHVGHPKVSVVRGREVAISTDDDQPVLADGEVVGHGPARFAVRAGALRVRVPAR